MSLIPKVTSLLQPKDQGLLLAEEGEESVLDLYKKINMKDCCYMIAEAWNQVKNLTMKRAWKRINGTSTKEQLELEKQKEKANELEQEVSMDEIVNIAKGISECDVDDVEEWLLCDTNDQGLQMADDEILESE
uniref:DDE-1 domain-containing protein n=1 Tax=Timema genevievae TaxID=629358 RepID=A0A7R9PPX1_TIMGE|nr:unnamed protein product [Timema genevievae]